MNSRLQFQNVEAGPGARVRVLARNARNLLLTPSRIQACTLQQEIAAIRSDLQVRAETPLVRWLDQLERQIQPFLL